MLKEILSFLTVAAPLRSAFTPATVGAPTDFAADVTRARKRLTDAIDAHEKAKIALQDASAVVSRVQALIDGVKPAEAEANAASEAAASAAEAWAANGARGDMACDPELLDAASAAAWRAADARVLAQGARSGLQAAKAAEDDARVALDFAEERVKVAVGEVLLSIAEPEFARLDRAYVEYTDAYHTLAALREVLRPWGPAHPWSNVASGAFGTVKQRLSDLEIAAPTSDELYPHAQGWADFARRLAGDPEVTF